ncbi:hypothetical protein D047_2496B, partial [Vibrio parahaemolyticus VPTS-2010_2]
ILFGCK